MEALSEFDNNVTATYKAASLLGVPVRYTYIPPDGSIQSVFTFVNNGVLADKSITVIYDELTDITTALSAEEIAMVYLHITLTLKYEAKDILPIINGFYDRLNKASREVAKEEGMIVRIAILRDTEDLNAQYQVWTQRFTALRQKDAYVLTGTIAIPPPKDFIPKGILGVQNTLASLKPIPVSELEVTKVIMNYTPTWRPAVAETLGAKIDLADGIEIFNQAVPSFAVPFIQYNDGEGKRYQRVWSGVKEDDDVPNYRLAVQAQTKTSKPDMMYLTVWTGVPGSVPTAESYSACIYNLTTGEIRLPAPIAGVKMMYDRLTTALPALALGLGKENRIQASFYVDEVEIVESVLHFMILNDFIFNPYLYIDEKDKARAEKKRLNIHYRTFSDSLTSNEEITGTGYISNTASVSVTFGPIEAEDAEDVIAPLPGFAPEATTEATESTRIKVNVIKAESQVVLNQFLEVFTRLLRRYMENKHAYEAYFRAIIPGSTPLKATKAGPKVELALPEEGEGEGDEEIVVESDSKGPAPAKTVGKCVVADTKIKTLKTLAPEVFIETYARQCQCKHQPIIIKADEQSEWEQKTFMGIGGVTHRQIMPYPPPRTPGEVPRWLMVCPSDVNPYPALKRNDNLENGALFPYIPCCAKSDTLSSATGNYSRYYEEKKLSDVLAKPRETSKASYRMATMKILKAGRKASIPPALSELLRSSYTEEGSEEDFVRVSIPVSASSLLHCVSLARSDEAYMGLTSVEGREAYVLSLRERITRFASALVYKQELYDLSTEEIKARVLDPKVFLDPYLFYRGVEEFFGVNIFVFNPNGPLKESAIPGIHDATITGPVIEIPRCKVAHIRVPRPDRLTVIILKHWGAEINPLTHPHCELIVSRGQIIGSGVKVVPRETASPGLPLPEENDEGVEDLGAVMMAPTGTGGYGTEPGVSSKGTSIFGPDMANLLFDVLKQSFHSYVWSFPRKVGKSNNLSSEIQTRDDPYSRINWLTTFTGFKIVSQQVDGYGKLRALGVEVIDEKATYIVTLMVPPSQPLNVPLLPEVTIAPEALVRRLLGSPSGITKVGLWYTAADYQWAVFVPAIMATPADIVSPPPPIQRSSEAPHTLAADLRNPIKEIRTMKRATSILMQLITWAWRQDRNANPIRTWWEQWVVRDTSATMKTASDGSILPLKINRRLPPAKTTLEAINSISSWWPPYFVSGTMPPGPILPAKRAGLPLPGDEPLAEIVDVKIAPRSPGQAGIHLYPALYDLAFGYFQHRAKQIDGLPLDDEMVAPITHLAGLYIWDTDFIQIPKSVVFTNVDHLTGWLLSQTRRGTAGTLINPILTKVELSMALNMEPFLYRDIDTGKMYLIQNVKSGELQRAIRVSLVWYNRGINIGSGAEPAGNDPSILPYVTYGVSRSQTLVPIHDGTNGHTPFIQLIRYTPDWFAAMLPIL